MVLTHLCCRSWLPLETMNPVKMMTVKVNPPVTAAAAEDGLGPGGSSFIREGRWLLLTSHGGHDIITVGPAFPSLIGCCRGSGGFSLVYFTGPHVTEDSGGTFNVQSVVSADSGSFYRLLECPHVKTPCFINTESSHEAAFEAAQKRRCGPGCGE
ncbi:uncharacterized protein V6R79_014924 [Siganus canaliculatus]